MRQKPYYHDSSFTLPVVKRLSDKALRTLTRFIHQARRQREITATQRDCMLAFVQAIGWECKLQIAQAALAAMADASVDTLARAQELMVEAGMLRVHHIIQRGPRGGTVQDINAYELVALPDPQAADDRVLSRFKNSLRVKKAARFIKRAARQARQGLFLNVAEEDERSRSSARRQLEMLTRGQEL